MKKTTIIIGFFAIALSIAACKKDNAANSNPSAELYPVLPESTAEYYSNRFGGVPVNQLINEKATLGRVLFYEKQMSVNNATACASCHKQEFAFADNVALSPGFNNKPTGRNSMAIQNLNPAGMSKQFNSPVFFDGVNLFWDARENNLKNLVMRPISNHVEMGIGDLNTIPAKLARLPYYAELFRKAYGDEQITLERISESVALFMMAIEADSTRFDMVTANKTAFNALETQGRHLFDEKYDCASCHRLHPEGYIMSSTIANIGLSATTEDKGMGAIMGNDSLYGVFRAPNLRNVALTAPYMHDGRFNTLEEVIDHYSKGIQDHPNLDARLRMPDGTPMRMNIPDDEKKALVAFLKTLTDYRMVTDEKFSNPFKVKS